MSRRDLAHVLGALERLAGDDPTAGVDVPATGVEVAEVDEAIGRGRGDMRTPLNLQSLAGDGLVTMLADGVWALTPQGVAWLAEDRELSRR